VPPCHTRPYASHKTPIMRWVVERVVLRYGAEAGGRPEIGRVKAAYDAKPRILVACPEHHGEYLIAGNVCMHVPVDVDVQIVKTVFRVDEVLAHCRLKLS